MKGKLLWLLKPIWRCILLAGVLGLAYGFVAESLLSKPLEWFWIVLVISPCFGIGIGMVALRVWAFEGTNERWIQ